jgi:hypothetical protein
MMLRRSNRRRAGVLVEFALVYPILLLLVLGMLDLSLAVLRFNQVSLVARHACRQAIVHGQYAPDGWKGGKWGPTTMMDDAVKPHLGTFDLAETHIVVDWLENSNNVEKNVKVTVSTPYRPMITYIFGNPSWTLQASSTMPIAH